MALLLALALLPAGAIAAQVGVNAIAARQAAYEESLSRRALQSIAVERSAIDELREMLRVLAARPELNQISAGDCRQWLGAVVERYPYLRSLSVSSNEGRIMCSVPAAPANFISPPSSLRTRARTLDRFVIGYVERGGLTDIPVLAALEPVRNESGVRIGFIGASIDIGTLREILNRGRTLDGARAAIVDESGFVIAESTVETDADLRLPSTAQVRNHLGPQPSFVAVPGGAAVIAPLHAPDLFIVMAWAPDQPSWRRWGELAFSVAAPLLIWLFAIGAGWFAIEVYVARPLSNLEAAARSFARGEEVHDPPALATAPEEIRALRRTMAAMAKTLRGREQRLVEALAEERALLREVHHRVKNNLQMVASLLNIQARGARDDSEARGLARAHDRVQLLAAVHQRIYSSGEVRELRLDDLAADIARQLLQSRGLQGADVSFDFGEVRADADRAVPLAFLIGESISSALDEPDALRGLKLMLRQDETGEVRFVADADVNMNEAPKPASGRLVDAFARQLGASVGRDASRPLSLWVSVPPPSAAS